jgi:hypothetical protein
MSRAEAAISLGGLHLSTIGKLARAGKLERVFVGRRSMVTVASVQALAGGVSVARSSAGRPLTNPKKAVAGRVDPGANP